MTDWKLWLDAPAQHHNSIELHISSLGKDQNLKYTSIQNAEVEVQNAYFILAIIKLKNCKSNQY